MRHRAPSAHLTHRPRLAYEPRAAHLPARTSPSACPHPTLYSAAPHPAHPRSAPPPRNSPCSTAHLTLMLHASHVPACSHSPSHRRAPAVLCQLAPCPVPWLTARESAPRASLTSPRAPPRRTPHPALPARTLRAHCSAAHLIPLTRLSSTLLTGYRLTRAPRPYVALYPPYAPRLAPRPAPPRLRLLLLASHYAT